MPSRDKLRSLVHANGGLLDFNITSVCWGGRTDCCSIGTKFKFENCLLIIRQADNKSYKWTFGKISG